MGVVPIPVPRYSTFVSEVDGKRGGWGPIHVRPAKHWATVLHEFSGPVVLCGYLGCIATSSVILKIDFSTEAGHEYGIAAERRNERKWIWVEDITTGKVVAGEKPPTALSEPAQEDAASTQ
jgi:hypothetical protein